MPHCGHCLLFHWHRLWSNLQLLCQIHLLWRTRLQQWIHRRCGNQNMWVIHFGKNWQIFNFPWYDTVVSDIQINVSWIVLNIILYFGPLCLLTHVAPCLPQNIYTIANCDSISSAVITWHEAAGAETYIVEARGNRKDFYNCSSTNTSCTLTDLVCGESLSVWIVATNGYCTTDPVLGEVAETGEWFWVMW